LSDQQVLDHGFKLSDAQELVARQSGFASWEALRRGIQAMPDEADRTASRVVITAAEPQLFVSDIKASCEFFTTKLGFAVAYIYGDPPFSGQVTRDGAALNLRWVDRPVIDPQLREREELLSAAMTVSTADEIKQLYLEFQAAGVSFQRPLKREPWGARTFIVKDPDGNLLLFAGPAE
jgi:catechol 2,3-dioxygenase-like lactoylglutathione lyase family enzyme